MSERQNLEPLSTAELKGKDGVKPFGQLAVYRGHGPVSVNIGFPGINQTSSGVVGSITEIDRGDTSGRPFLGSAAMTMQNIAPKNGSVDVHAFIDFGSDVFFRITLIAG